MPATPEEMVEAARMLARTVLAPDNVPDIRWSDGERITEQEARNLFALAIYELRLLRERQRAPAQRNALRLLRTLLTPEQRLQLRRCREIRVQGSLGGFYRLIPAMGAVWALEKHGRRWFGVGSYCIHTYHLHEDGCYCPPADETVAHLLLLLSDEADFLATANARVRRPDCWNGEYLRRMRRHRLASAEAMAGDIAEVAA